MTSRPARSSERNFRARHAAWYSRGETPSEFARWFQDAWAKTGKKLDMGKACIRFKRAEDLALDVIGEAVRRMTAKKYIAIYESILGSRRSGPKASASTAEGAAAKGSAKTKRARR